MESFRERQVLQARHSEHIRRPHSTAAAELSGTPEHPGADRERGVGLHTQRWTHEQEAGAGGDEVGRFETEAQAVARETASRTEAMDATRRQALAENHRAMQRERDMRQTTLRLW